MRPKNSGLALTAMLASALMSSAQTVNLNGVWVTPGGYRQNPQSEWSLEKLPFTAKGQRAFDSNKPGKGPRQVPPATGNDPIGGANPPGLMRALVYNRPFELVQLPGKVIQLFEWGRVWRTIYTDGRKVPDEIPAGPYWYGYSVGRWEGDTLVVTTIGLDERAWMDEYGTPFTADAKFEERWQRTAPNKLQVKVTVTDPEFYSKPWTSNAIVYNVDKSEPQEIIFAPMDENAFNERIRNPAGLPAKPPEKKQ